jgi:glycosyltransferase involved in cell wall biosynthesis
MDELMCGSGNRTDMKIARIVSIPLAFVHILKQLNYFREKGLQVELISSEGDYWEVIDKAVGLRRHIIRIPRDINPFKDLLALWLLFRHFRKSTYHIVHSTTPKAGLLVALSAFLAHVPIRLHTFTGQRWATLAWPLKGILRVADKTICRLNSRVYADSHSQAEFLIREGIVARHKISVLHRGSLGGIDLDRFDPHRYEMERQRIREQLGLAPNSVNVLFVGRITRDKGIIELIDAFTMLTHSTDGINLLLVGPFEPHLDPLPQRTVETIKNHNNIHAVGLQPQPEHYYRVADIFCLPSYREGFGTVVLEAAAMGLPTVGTRIPGLVDSVVDGETGILIDRHCADDLSAALARLIDDEELRNAQERARRDFDYRLIAEKQLEEYRNLAGH